MQKLILASFFILFLSACGSRNAVLPGDTIEETLVEYLAPSSKDGWLLSDENYFRSQHRSEIKNTIKVHEKTKSSKGDIFLVLFSYTIDEQTSHKWNWMREIDGIWTINFTYYNEYGEYDDSDLLGKGEEWSEQTDKDIWW